MLDPRVCYQPFWLGDKEPESLNARTDSQRDVGPVAPRGGAQVQGSTAETRELGPQL
jgi:hypothetical protein